MAAARARSPALTPPRRYADQATYAAARYASPNTACRDRDLFRQSAPRWKRRGLVRIRGGGPESCRCHCCGGWGTGRGGEAGGVEVRGCRSGGCDSSARSIQARRGCWAVGEWSSPGSPDRVVVGCWATKRCGHERQAPEIHPATWVTQPYVWLVNLSHNVSTPAPAPVIQPVALDRLIANTSYGRS